MKSYKLDKEEQQLLKEVEAGEWVSVKNFRKELKRYQEIAKNTFSKARNVNLRISEKTFRKLKTKAYEEGIPYQTLASSILHKYVNS